ncbi:alpha/beta hydrolase [Defluviimonas sp. WL0050]|uniref:Alpha/beta hydrolase n=1 Tax=Albidovulum litorale TaxID=2984134 RepID=A0ABT2ZKX4_9RHOB|nr:alpha/beta hydrolase [Defluviimonas sp. WL0050]MCV2871772.1 alpha/beta hydrolase [Defluviimonas sp. WL0050]
MRYDDAFANGKYIEGAEAYPPLWAEKAAQFRAALGARARLGLPYGTGERNWFDLFLPKGKPEGLLVFIHGGYWRAFSPRDFSHLAAGSTARGWACAMPAYTLAPNARISAITAEIAASLNVMAAEVAGPIVMTGHSAGGHLAARMVCRDIALHDAVAACLARSVPISPLTDLRPLIETAMNDDFRLTRAEAAAESPALLTRRSGVPVHVWVGGAERPAFLDQARRLGNAWACPVTIDAGRHHFDVIEGLEAPDTPLMMALSGATLTH